MKNWSKYAKDRFKKSEHKLQFFIDANLGILKHTHPIPPRRLRRHDEISVKRRKALLKEIYEPTLVKYQVVGHTVEDEVMWLYEAVDYISSNNPNKASRELDFLLALRDRFRSRNKYQFLREFRKVIGLSW